MKRKPGLDPKDRDPATMTDLEDAMRQLVESPTGTKSENREPSREELKRKYRVVRR